MNGSTDMRDPTHIQFTIFTLFLLLFHLTEYGDAGGSIQGVEIQMPPSHVALSGDLHVQIASSSFPPLLMQLSRLEGDLVQPLTTFPVYPVARALKMNATVVRIPCGYFSRGGQYYVLVKKQPIGSKNITSPSDPEDSSVITRSLDVRWPMPQLSLTPENLQTYPERPVNAILEFPEVMCPPKADSPISAIPEFWLELYYCGQSLLTCDNNESGVNKSAQVLYSEQVRGFPGKRVLTLRCELFGLAGHYALFLRPTSTGGPLVAFPHTAAYVKVFWSDQFVFNVHARSIFPCDALGGGVAVLFQYPSCILASGDRVRLFGRLRRHVASAATPTALDYVAERSVSRGRHSVRFECDVFVEKYVEYCFVYVSRAISGAVADVRMDCVPTLPVSDQESGGWGSWSAWTPCSTTCIGGTRSRYRFCDSPPPRYGAKFCEGKAVETEKCGSGIGGGWECFLGGSITGEMAAEIPEVKAEVGPYCRCGCVVHLGLVKPKRLLATSSQSCPGRTFWLIQADDNHLIRFKVDQFRSTCGTQSLKVRDGNALSSDLLADISDGVVVMPSTVNSTGPNLLLEFSSEEMSRGGEECIGGFVAEASQFRSRNNNITSISVAQSVGVIPAVALKLTAVHIAAIFFLSGLIIATALLGAQYLFRYHKYHIAKAEDQDSLADATGSTSSIPLTARAASSATLISEVISMTRMRPNIMSRNRHVRLRESMDCENSKSDNEVTLAKEEDSLSMGSTATLTQPAALAVAENETNEDSEEPTSTSSLPTSPHSGDHPTLKRSSTMTSEKDTSTEKEGRGKPSRREAVRRLSNGCYSSAGSMISRATIVSTNNAKEKKEKKNREKLLAGPTGSEFSIAAQDTDLEMDYYDYNVVNAGAAPGSYLGMDPAFLVWIPPLDEGGEILPEDGHESHEMEDIRPKIYIDPGSNKESPEEEVLLPRPRSISICESTSKCSPILRARNRKSHASRGDGIDNKFIHEVEPLVHGVKVVDIQLHDFPKKLRTKIPEIGEEKETKVEKSPSLDGDYMDDIKFADEEEDLSETQCNIGVSYQDSNIVSSS